MRNSRPPYWLRAWFGIIFHDALLDSAIRFIQAIFSDLSMISKSIIFRPPQCFSPMIVFFLILRGLPSQMKLKIIWLILSKRDLDTVSKELQYMSLDKPNVLTILILPIKVGFLFFQLLSVFSKGQTFFNYYGFYPNWISTFFVIFRQSTVKVTCANNILSGKIFKLIFEFFKKRDLLVRVIRGLNVH